MKDQLIKRFGEHRVSEVKVEEGEMPLLLLDLELKSPVTVLVTNGLSNIKMPVPEKEIVLHSSPYKGILDAINRIDPYMVVIGQKGYSKIKDLIMGSTAKHLIEKVHCPITVVPSFVSL